MERDYNALFYVTKKDFRVKLMGIVLDEESMQKGRRKLSGGSESC